MLKKIALWLGRLLITSAIDMASRRVLHRAIERAERSGVSGKEKMAQVLSYVRDEGTRTLRDAGEKELRELVENELQRLANRL